MQSNESLHLTIKKPPNPNPTSTIAILSHTDDLDSLLTIVRHYLSGVTSVPKDVEFLDNVKDEVLKALSTGTVLTVARHTKSKQLHIILQEPS